MEALLQSASRTHLTPISLVLLAPSLRLSSDSQARGVIHYQATWNLGPQSEGNERYLRIYLDPLQNLGCCCSRLEQGEGGKQVPVERNGLQSPRGAVRAGPTPSAVPWKGGYGAFVFVLYLKP